MAEWINTVLQGVLLGGLYAMFAVGLSLSFGVMRMINIAHGDMIVFGAYAVVVATALLGLPLPLAVLLVVPAVALLGYLAQRWVFNRTLGDDILRPLVLTFGLSIVIRNGLQAVFSADWQTSANGCQGDMPESSMGDNGHRSCTSCTSFAWASFAIRCAGQMSSG